jgi:hypothetical protein
VGHQATIGSMSPPTRQATLPELRAKARATIYLNGPMASTPIFTRIPPPSPQRLHRTRNANRGTRFP